jgi:hypothetical protein
MLWMIPAGVLVGGVWVLVTLQRGRFARRVAREVHELWTMRGAAPGGRRPLETLPEPVRRYLELAGAVRAPPVRSVRLRHGGAFRPSLEGSWLPIRGEQYFAADPPGFVWWGRVRLAPGLWIDARDRSLAGEGNMRIMLASTWTFADTRGPEMDRGALQRLLGEMVWFPSTLLDDRYVGWTPADDASARAALRVGGREVTVMFRFGPDGLPSGVTVDRYRDVGGRGVLTPWTGEVGDYREVDGLRVPYRIEASWTIDDRPRPYARFLVEHFEIDPVQPYGRLKTVPPEDRRGFRGDLRRR